MNIQHYEIKVSVFQFGSNLSKIYKNHIYQAFLRKQGFYSRIDFSPLEPKKRLALKEQNTTFVASVPSWLREQDSNLRPIA